MTPTALPDSPCDRTSYLDEITSSLDEGFVAKLREDDNLWGAWLAGDIEVRITPQGWKVLQAVTDERPMPGQYL